MLCVVSSLSGPRRGVDFSVCLAFDLLARTEWLLPSSSRVELETGGGVILQLLVLSASGVAVAEQFLAFARAV